jgi:hypothetical protein
MGRALMAAWSAQGDYRVTTICPSQAEASAVSAGASGCPQASILWARSTSLEAARREYPITTDSTERAPAEPPPRAIELIATEWLAAEREETAIASPRTEATARRLAAEYEDAIRAASQEELRLAWEGARVIQARCDMGTVEWAQARSVSELLRTEYEASR